MGNQESITALLEQLRTTSDAQTDIYKHFYESARQVAKAKLSSELKGRVSPSTIAHGALQDSLEGLQNLPAKLASREDFDRLLRMHINHHLADARDREKAKKRDVTRDVAAEHAEAELSRADQPDLKAIVDDLALKSAQIILAEKNELHRTISLIGILTEHTAGDIQEMITSLPLAPDESQGDQTTMRRAPSISTIHVIIQKTRARVRKELGLDDE